MANGKKYGLQDAYSVRTPADNIDLYKDWAQDYDQGFARARGYLYPAHIAQVVQKYGEKNDQPVLDVGAGTGLVGRAIADTQDCLMDAIDISEQMLDQSRAKGIYRQHILADLTKTLNIDDNVYGAIVSVGTFTHGHVGPKALYELWRIAKPNALFCIGINITAFDRYGFGSTLAEMQADDLIEPLKFEKTRYYRDAQDQHANDIGLTAIFRKKQ